MQKLFQMIKLSKQSLKFQTETRSHIPTLHRKYSNLGKPNTFLEAMTQMTHTLKTVSQKSKIKFLQACDQTPGGQQSKSIKITIWEK